MVKQLLKSHEDFIDWKNYYKYVAYDALEAEKEEEPNEYPCVVISHNEPYCEGAYLYILHYHFVYSSDFTA